MTTSAYNALIVIVDSIIISDLISTDHSYA